MDCSEKRRLSDFVQDNIIQDTTQSGRGYITSRPEDLEIDTFRTGAEDLQRNGDYDVAEDLRLPPPACTLCRFLDSVIDSVIAASSAQQTDPTLGNPVLKEESIQPNEPARSTEEPGRDCSWCIHLDTICDRTRPCFQCWFAGRGPLCSYNDPDNLGGGGTPKSNRPEPELDPDPDPDAEELPADTQHPAPDPDPNDEELSANTHLPASEELLATSYGTAGQLSGICTLCNLLNVGCDGLQPCGHCLSERRELWCKYEEPGRPHPSIRLTRPTPGTSPVWHLGSGRYVAPDEGSEKKRRRTGGE